MDTSSTAPVAAKCVWGEGANADTRGLGQTIQEATRLPLLPLPQTTRTSKGF
jgi:hypothetical protein